jgi:fatty-acyl-CoA synthase
MLPIDFLYRAAHYQPDFVAVETDDQQLTYAEVARRVDALATHFQARVPGCQNRIGICAHNTLTHYIAILATYASGNIWVALNPAHSKRNLDRIVQVARPQLFVADDDCLDNFAVNSSPVLCGSELAGAMHRHSGQAPQRQAIGLDHLQAIKFGVKSGELPKAVMQPCRVAATHQIHMRIMHGFHRSDVGLAVSPLAEAGGDYILPFAAAGGRYVLIREPAAGAILDAIERQHITRIFMAPALLSQVVDAQAAQPRGIASLHAITYGEAPMPVSKIRQAQAVLGNRIDVTYGQAEASQCITGATREELADERYVGSVGRPGPLVQVKVMDSRGRVLAPGGIGEVVARGDLLMSGYLGRPELTASTIVDGWLHTGDLGSFDEDGYLTLHGRLQEAFDPGTFELEYADAESLEVAA